MQTFPRHDVDPKEKNASWLCQFAKAVWANIDKSTAQVFYKNRDKYDEFDDYANGRQSTDKYKPYLIPEKQEDETWLNFDWSVRPIISKFRPISISKLLQREFNIVATPIDSLSRDETDKVLADMKVKVLMREQMKMLAPELAGNPQLMREPGEPEDMEEWQMRVDYGGKLNFSMGAEEGIQLVHYNNDVEQRRKEILTSLYDRGCAAYKKWVDENDCVQYRVSDAKAVIINDCEKEDFSDLRYCGEIIKVPFTTLSRYFTDAELDLVYEKNRSHSFNPATVGSAGPFSGKYDDCSGLVLDLRLYTEDIIVYKNRVDSRGNKVVREADFKKKDSKSVVELPDGTIEGKYRTAKVEMVYEVKWIIGTDLVYECGIAKDLPRSERNYQKTDLGYYLYALNYNKGVAQGVVERMIPALDDYQITKYRIANIKARMIPTGWAIDFDALENVALGKGGKALSPKKILQMFVETGVLAYRRKDIHYNNQNYKPVEPLENSIAKDLVALYEDVLTIIDELRALSGLNEVTDSSNPDPKLLVGVMNQFTASTNNALYPLMFAEKNLLVRLSKGILGSLQVIIKRKPVAGLVRAIGSTNVKFIEVSKSIATRDFDIMIEDRPTEQDRQQLMERLNLKDAQGLIDPEDIVIISNTYNLKQAQMLLAYKVKKRRKEDEVNARAREDANTKRLILSNKSAEEQKRETLKEEYRLKKELVDLEKGWDYRIKEMQQTGKSMDNQANVEGKIVSTAISAEAKTDKESGKKPGE